ncbi:MAG: diadenylate cyclase CdaA [Bacteroidales bacterium]|nr:diadenylate cyclase CdaA [Bacteroidales bacterium]
MFGFLHIGIKDIIDILLVAFLLYQIYYLIKGTAAIKIFTGIALLYLVWLTVRAFDMILISSILGHVMGVGVVALLIVFQQEIRRFFMLLSNKYLSRINFSFKNILPFFTNEEPAVKVWSIVKACTSLSKTKTGALIAITRESELYNIIETGIKLNADTSSQLLNNLFFKNSPLHDGAVIIKNEKIIAAGCILPVSEKDVRHEDFGLRHRAALGIVEQTDAVVIVVSEQTGNITLFYSSAYQKNLSITDLRKKLEHFFIEKIDEVTEK